MQDSTLRGTSRWERYSLTDPDALRKIELRTGVHLKTIGDDNFSFDGQYMAFKLRFLCLEGKERKETQAFFLVGPDLVVSLEPSNESAPLDEAQRRLDEDNRDNDAYDIFYTILQAITDSVDDLLDGMSDDLSEGLVQTNSVLENLDAKTKDFGISDVVDGQTLLANTEEILSKCAQNIMSLNLVAQRVYTRLPDNSPFLVDAYKNLMNDMDEVQQDVLFVHERIRFLQTLNGLALGSKQNQIIKIFTVVAAVFLPALLVSTYYSMNLAVLPILEWQFVEPVTLIFTVILAILPLGYVMRRGWLA